MCNCFVAYDKIFLSKVSIEPSGRADKMVTTSDKMIVHDFKFSKARSNDGKGISLADEQYLFFFFN